jgi:hypothetical protein
MESLKLIVMFLALAMAFQVNAGSFMENIGLSKDGEYVIVEVSGSDNLDKLQGIAEGIRAALIEDGYGQKQDIDQVKEDTWCRAVVKSDREVIGECYSPHQGHGVSVRDDFSILGGYAGVVEGITKLREQHRKAIKLLDIK